MVHTREITQGTASLGFKGIQVFQTIEALNLTNTFRILH